MKYIYIFFAVMVGCAPYMLPTPSGKPEVVIGATRKQIAEALINQLVVDGFAVEQQTENLVAGSRVDGIWHVRHTKQYSMTTQNDSVRVILNYLLDGSPPVRREFVEERQAELYLFKKSLER